MITVYKAKYANDNLNWRPSDTSGVPDVIPSVPRNAIVTVNSTTQLTVSWIIPLTVGDLAGYTIIYKLGSAPTSHTDGTLLASVSTGTTSYAHTGLTPDTTYYYAIYGFTFDGQKGPFVTCSGKTNPRIATSITCSAVVATNTSNVTITGDVNVNVGQIVCEYNNSGVWTQIGTATTVDSAGKAVFTNNGLTVTRTYRCRYVENNNFSASTSSSVQILATTVNLSKTISGPNAVLTATVTNGDPNGDVQFFANGALIATDTVSPWTISHTPTVTTTYTAKYIAGGTRLGDTSSSVVATRTDASYSFGTGNSSGHSRMSSAPFAIDSRFDTPRACTIKRFRMEIGGYYGNSNGKNIVVTGRILNSGGTTVLASVNATLSQEAGNGTGMSEWFDITDKYLNDGIYRIGFSRKNTEYIQWDEDTTQGTMYFDGSLHDSSACIPYQVEYYYIT